MSGKMTWNYRIIMDDTTEDPHDCWYAIYEVYYLDGVPIDHTVSQSSVFGDSMEELNQTLVKMRDALNHPVLKKSEFPPMDNYRRDEWMRVREIGEEYKENPNG
jgi:hypothetical protein